MARLLSGLIVWLALFGICLGLGYPAVSRYDPRTEGNADAIQYYRMIEGGPADARPPWRYRLLTPLLAKPVYLVVRDRVGTWDAVGVSMLVVNAAFTATAALLLLDLARKAGAAPGVALAGAFLFLLNFDIAQEYLAGLVDAVEGLCMLVLARLLWSGRWWPLPLLGIVGVLGKETFLGLGPAFAATWWLVEARARQGRPPLAPAIWIAAMLAVGLGLVTLLRVIVVGSAETPLDIANYAGGRVNPLVGLLGILGDRSTWYIFAWLLPLGLWGLPRIGHRPWVAASLVAGAAGLALGAYSNARGGAARAVFDAAGPVLSLGAAVVLARLAGWQAERHSD